METRPFTFQTEQRLVLLTQARANSLPTLLNGLLSVPGSSIFYHTHHQFLAHHFEKPRFHNDFALWVADVLQEQELGERLAGIDLLAFSTVRELRMAIAEIVRSRVAQSSGPTRVFECAAADCFHFCKAKSFIMPTGRVAHTVREFSQLLPEVSKESLYFHFFEARLRLGRQTNDFSHWMRGKGREDLAEAIDTLNPYIRTLDELKNAIIEICKGRYKGQEI